MFKIVWTPTATDSFYEILEYLIDNWSNEVALKFGNKTLDLLKLLSTNKYLCPPSRLHKYIRKCVVNRQTSLIYHLVNDEIHLIAFLDNRRINTI